MRSQTQGYSIFAIDRALRASLQHWANIKVGPRHKKPPLRLNKSTIIEKSRRVTCICFITIRWNKMHFKMNSKSLSSTQFQLRKNKVQKQFLFKADCCRNTSIIFTTLSLDFDIIEAITEKIRLQLSKRFTKGF